MDKLNRVYPLNLEIYFVLQWQIQVQITWYSKAKLPCYSRSHLTTYFCIPIPYNEKNIFFFFFFFFFDDSSRRPCRSSYNWSISACSALVVGAQTQSTVMLNGLPWIQTKIIILLLRLHGSAAFWTPLFTMRVTPFLLRDSCPQWWI